MRFDRLVQRLSTLPDPLPRGTRDIDAVVLGQPGSLPDWIRRPRTEAIRRAAGLVLLFPSDAGEAHLVLTERPSGDMRHAGQVSLPGGKEDPGDEFPVGTALREAAEEVGLDPAQAGVSIVGVLDDVDVRVTGFMLTPVLAIAEREPALVPDTREVAAILLPPVSMFLPDAPIEIREEERDGYRLRYGGYPFQGVTIWGATARVLAQLGAVLAGERP